MIFKAQIQSQYFTIFTSQNEASLGTYFIIVTSFMFILQFQGILILAMFPILIINIVDYIIQMKAGKNKELDYLLINLCQQPQPTNREQALQYRERHSLRREPWTWWGTDQYYRYGPGVILYFTLLKYLILLLGVITITSLPALIVNYQGTGLQIYGKSVSSTLMRFSLSNQPSLDLLNNGDDTEKDLQILGNIKVGHGLLIITDILSSLIFFCFLIFWQLKSQDLVCQMIKKQALPSYHTLIVNLPQKKSISQQELRLHFQNFGGVRQVEFVYDYGAFLLQIKQFLETVQKYNQEKNWMKKEKLYDQIEQGYLRIKKLYQSAAQSNISLHQVPFHPKMAFVSFDDPDLANRVNGIYKYKIGSLNLDLDGCALGVKRCHVEPLSIIWQNYHMPSWSQIQRSWLFGFLVSVILIVTLLAIFLMSLHTDRKWNNQKAATNGGINFQTAANSTDKKIINTFCDSLNYKNFQWKYYEVCAQYFSDFEHHWMFVLSISGIIVCINIFLIKIVFFLAELRRFRTLPEQKCFLIISIFLTYFFSSSLLPILLRGQIQVQGQSWSIAAFAQKLFPSLPTVQVYRQANRKWYLQIGKLLLVNYILALNICPWLYIGQQWLLQKIREIWSYFTSSQRKMKERLLDRQFFWQFYNAVLLIAIYTCLIFSAAMPLFYLLAFLSMASLFLTSKIIFHSFTRQPQVYDHKLNSFMTKAICFSLIVHQLASTYFLNVEQIFPQSQSYLFSKASKTYIYLGISILVSIFLLIPKKIASIIRKKTEFRKDELMITEQINSSFGAAGNRQLKEFQQKVEHKHKQKVPLVRIRKGTYLNSYKMQDNPYYNNLSYTLLILYQTIIQNKEPDLSFQKKKQLFLKKLSENKQIAVQKGHHSLYQEMQEKFVEQEILESERALNQSI